MDQKLDRIKDSDHALIARFEQNENALKDHHTIQINQVVGAVQMRVFVAEIAEFGFKGQNNVVRQRMYTKTFRISQFTTVEQLRTAACDYWGLIEKDFMLYQIQEDHEAKDLEDEMGQKVTKVVEQLYAIVQSAQNSKDPHTGQVIKSVNKDDSNNTLAIFYLGKRNPMNQQKNLSI